MEESLLPGVKNGGFHKIQKKHLFIQWEVQTPKMAFPLWVQQKWGGGGQMGALVCKAGKISGRGVRGQVLPKTKGPKGKSLGFS